MQLVLTNSLGLNGLRFRRGALGLRSILRQGEQAKCYTGRVWRSSESWVFQEEGTGITVSAELNPNVSLRQSYPQCEAKLYRAMRAEHVKQKQAIARAAKKMYRRQK